MCPGCPSCTRGDLVHWRLVTHAIPSFADSAFTTPQHGNGVWAPSIRKHDGWFWIFIRRSPIAASNMLRARTPRGPWTAPHLVQAGKGLIDATPLWDDDGRAWLVHAYARSRSGIKHRLVVRGMRPDGTALLDSGRIVFEDSVHHPTAEGPKFYKRDGWYWIFAPAGGVATGWQLAMRARHATRSVRSPHGDVTRHEQREWPASGWQGHHRRGDDWFVHFQDRGAYGRIVHLQPMRWTSDGWPVIGAAAAGDTTGTPVMSAPVPRVRGTPAPVALQTNDAFDSGRPGLQWQWQANPQPSWMAPARGALHLTAVPLVAPARSLWDAPNLLLQSFPPMRSMPSCNPRPAARMSVIASGWSSSASTTPMSDCSAPRTDGRSSRRSGAMRTRTCRIVTMIRAMQPAAVTLRVRVSSGARVQFAVRAADGSFVDVGAPFQARQGRWVGAKFGLMSIAAPGSTGMPTRAIVRDVRVTIP